MKEHNAREREREREIFDLHEGIFFYCGLTCRVHCSPEKLSRNIRNLTFPFCIFPSVHFVAISALALLLKNEITKSNVERPRTRVLISALVSSAEQGKLTAT